MTLARARRRRRYEDRRPRWWQIPEEAQDDGDYDRFGMMMKIDTFEQGWRDLINEHGFTPVMQARQYATSLEAITRMLNERRALRQMQLAHGAF